MQIYRMPHEQTLPSRYKDKRKGKKKTAGTTFHRTVCRNGIFRDVQDGFAIALPEQQTSQVTNHCTEDTDATTCSAITCGCAVLMVHFETNVTGPLGHVRKAPGTPQTYSSGLVMPL